MVLHNSLKISVSTHLRRLMSSVSSSAPLIISAREAFNLTQDTKVSFLDASWFMPNSPRKPQEEFLLRHLPEAKFLDLDKVSAPHDLGLKHMMPQERTFATACEKLGIEPSSHVIIYDTHGVFSSPRALFMFRSFGHNKSSILNGGLPAWVAERFPVENTPPSQPKSKTPLPPPDPTLPPPPKQSKKDQSPIPPKIEYPTPTLETRAIKSYEQIVANSNLDPVITRAELVLDARSRERYLGTDPEPRAEIPSGHIPNSVSLPFNMFLQKHSRGDYTTILPKEDIYTALVRAVGVDRADAIMEGALPVITSCGSGMTAGILWLGLKLLGVEKVSLYDESWTGYAMRLSSKIEKS